MKTICFVCHANICRSFCAERILDHLSKKKGRTDIKVISRGIYAQHFYAVPSKVTDYLASKGIVQGEHTATILTKTDLEESDLILTMTDDQKEYILDKWAQFTDKVFLLTEYVYDKEKEVKDPISMFGRSFNKIMDEIYKAVTLLLEKV